MHKLFHFSPTTTKANHCADPKRTTERKKKDLKNNEKVVCWSQNFQRKNHQRWNSCGIKTPLKEMGPQKSEEKGYISIWKKNQHQNKFVFKNQSWIPSSLKIRFSVLIKINIKTNLCLKIKAEFHLKSFT